MRDYEQEIIDFIDEGYNTKKYFLFGPKKVITLDMNIRDDLKLVYEDNEELMDEYFKRWNVDRLNFEVLNYFNPEYLGSKEPDPHKPLTLMMLVESAKAGKWLYD
jgi:hypothetical protein